MNSLERAKRFLAEKASRLAIAVVPLAAVAVSAVPAKAGVILQAGGPDCFVTTGTGNCNTVDFGGSSNILEGLALVSSGGASSSSFVNSTVGNEIVFSASDGVSSGGSLTTPTVVPVSWDFDLISANDPSIT